MLFTTGRRLVKGGSPFRRTGGDEFTKKSRRKTIGQIFWAAAGLLLVLGLVNVLYTVGPDTGPDASTMAAWPKAYRPPIVPPSPADVAKVRSSFASSGDGHLGDHPNFSSTLDDSLPAFQPRAEMPQPAPEPRTEIDPPVPAPRVTSLPATTSSPPPAVANNASAPANGIQAPELEGEKQLESGLAAANAAIQKDPSIAINYVLRGNVYGKKKLWDLAREDYTRALGIDHQCVPALFNLAEIDFMQGKYDAARPGFVALLKDPDFEDLASYSVFLCDMAGGHQEAAAKELNAFNQVGSNASYYFANIAWSLHQKKDDDARDWMSSATRIYAPDKVHIYATPLVYLGYFSKAPSAPSN